LLQLIEYSYSIRSKNNEISGEESTSGPGLGWEIRHSGLVGLKYLMAVRSDLVNDLLSGVVGTIIRG
jgi:hypothetical protein